jgi:hypothetical protein
LVLAAVSCRGSIEADADTEAETLRRRVNDWVASHGLDDEREPQERTLLAARVGRLDQQDAINATWRSEGMAILGWALGRSEWPAHDTHVDPAATARGLGFLEEAPVALATSALRSDSEILRAAEATFALHWRLREFSLNRTALDFAAFAERARFGPLEIGGLELAENDLAIDGQPLGKSHRWRQVLSIAQERHQAANWLRGYDPVYSEVETNT